MSFIWICYQFSRCCCCFFFGGGAGRPKNHATFIMRCCNLGSHMNFLTLANGVHDQRTLRLDYSSSMCCMFVLAKKVGKWHSKEIYTNNYKYTTFKLHMKHGEQNQSSSIISPFFIVGIHIFLWFFVFAAHCQAITSSFQPQNRSILHWTFGHGGLQEMGWIGPTGAMRDC